MKINNNFLLYFYFLFYVKSLCLSKYRNYFSLEIMLEITISSVDTFDFQGIDVGSIELSGEESFN